MLETNLLPATTVALAVTTALMLALRPLALKLGIVDRTGVPIVGGIAMLVGIGAGLTMLPLSTEVLLALVVASMLLVLIGVIDDVAPMAPTVRALMHVAVIILMIYGAGFALRTVGNPFGFGDIHLGPFFLFGTFIFALTIMNAYRLIDGADGLAGSLALVAVLSIALIGGYTAVSTAAALVIGAAVTGFQVFNFPVVWNRPVRSFMGDGGSALVGFSLVWLTLGISQGPGATISPVHCLWFVAMPIFDAMTCVVRRAFAGKPLFDGERDHFHHTLQRGGLGVRRALVVLTALQCAYAGVGIAAHFYAVSDAVMLAAWCVLGFGQRRLILLIAKWHNAWELRQGGAAAA